MATGIGAMSVAMLTLPLTSVLMATLLLGSDGVTVMPLVIVAVVVAYVASARIAPAVLASPTPASPVTASPAAGEAIAAGGSHDEHD
jgi:hypothetical protein